MRDAFDMALHTLRANHVRGALTTTGLMIGVASIIILVGLGQGLQARFEEQFGQLATQIVVTPDQVGPGLNQPRNLTDRDAAALRNRTAAPDVTGVTPVVTSTETVSRGATYTPCTVAGSTLDYLRVANRQLEAGAPSPTPTSTATPGLYCLAPRRWMRCSVATTGRRWAVRSASGGPSSR